MKEFRRLRPGNDHKQWQVYQKAVHARALEILEPCKDHGREHLAGLIGRFTYEQHNDMTLICAGMKEQPKTRDEQWKFSVEIAAAGLLFGALIKLFEDQNTQWDDDTMIYYQLVNHFENLTTKTAGLAVRL